VHRTPKSERKGRGGGANRISPKLTKEKGMVWPRSCEKKKKREEKAAFLVLKWADRRRKSKGRIDHGGSRNQSPEKKKKKKKRDAPSRNPASTASR